LKVHWGASISSIS